MQQSGMESETAAGRQPSPVLEAFYGRALRYRPGVYALLHGFFASPLSFATPLFCCLPSVFHPALVALWPMHLIVLRVPRARHPFSFVCYGLGAALWLSGIIMYRNVWFDL